MKSDIRVFTTPTCPHCKKIKQWLEQKGYDYKEHNVANDKEKAREMIKETGQRGVPQVFVEDKAIVGFQPKKIEAAVEG